MRRMFKISLFLLLAFFIVIIGDDETRAALRRKIKKVRQT